MFVHDCILDDGTVVSCVCSTRRNHTEPDMDLVDEEYEEYYQGR